MKFQVRIRGNASRYAVVRFVAFGCEKVTIDAFEVLYGPLFNIYTARRVNTTTTTTDDDRS